jgi:hypothetical protein
MKCYCYETNQEFIFCVENVESEQLEDVILHMAWEKTEDKFLRSYPQNAFSNLNEKALISDNFARLGKEVFESVLLGFDWEKPLRLLTPKFNESGIEWYIVGSVSDAVRGINVKPGDLDIVIHTRDYWKAKNLCYSNFPDSVIEPFQDKKGIPLQCFGRLFLAGTYIDVAADEQWNFENRKYEKASWNGYGLYVDSFQTRYQTEIARNREERIKAFNEFIKQGKHCHE